MSEKYASLLKIKLKYETGEIRFYDNPGKLEKGLKKIMYTSNEELLANVPFNGELSCEETLNIFQESFPDSRIIQNNDYIGLKVKSQYVHDLNKKFVDYFIPRKQKPVQKPKKPTEEEMMNMTVGEYYEKYLKDSKLK